MDVYEVSNVFVSLEYEPAVVFPGEIVGVRVFVSSKGREIKSHGVFVDLLGVESLVVNKRVSQNLAGNLKLHKETINEAFEISKPFSLAANENRSFEGQFQVPANFQPIYKGYFARYE